MQNAPARRAVRRVLVITLVLNLLVAAAKIVIGTITGALAITADGFHSLMDGVSNAAALVANHLAAQPPDEDHPYGHRRIETLAALFIGAMLLLTAWEIIQGAAERLISATPPQVTALTFAVLIATLVVNLFVSTYERRAGKRLNSELLLADAANTGADVFVTLSVLISMVLVSLFGWWWADSAAALVIVVLIGRAAWGIVRQTGGVLVDKAPYPPAQLTALVEELPAVGEQPDVQVMRARSRGPQDAAHIDIDVSVAPEITAAHTEAIAEAIRQQLAQSLGGVEEVEVHFVPQQHGEQNVMLVARACADALGLSAHDVRLRGADGARVLELHVEVPAGQTLAQAHDRVTQLEHNLRASLPDLQEVFTHIEPAGGEVIGAVDEAQSLHAQQVGADALALLRAQFPDVDWHHLHVYPQQDGFAVTLHAKLPANISIEAAHGIAEIAERLVKAGVEGITRLTVHTEPSDR